MTIGILLINSKSNSNNMKISNLLYLFLIILFGVQLCLFPNAPYVPYNMILGIGIGWLLGEIVTLVGRFTDKK